MVWATTAIVVVVRAVVAMGVATREAAAKGATVMAVGRVVVAMVKAVMVLVVRVVAVVVVARSDARLHVSRASHQPAAPGQRHWPCPDRGDRSGAELKSGVCRRGDV